jgi:large subunit ribosomal protein L16
MNMLTPRKLKYRKAFKGRNTGNATSGNVISFANYAIQVLENVNLKSNTLEAAYKVTNKTVKSYSKIWFRVFPHKPVTKKPIEVRMGKGKGSVDHYVACLRPGNIIFEFDAPSLTEAQKVLSQCIGKLGVSCRLLQRKFGGVFLNNEIV